MRDLPVKFVNLGEDRGFGNLVGIQPFLTPQSYRNRQEFASTLTATMTAAAEEGLIHPNTVVVFPEYIGLFLYLADEFPWVYRAKTLQEAIARSLVDEKIWIGALGLKYPHGKRLKGIQAELMRLKARTAVQHYQEVFSHLARQFRVTIVAGSIPLPEPRVEDGLLTISPGAHPWKGMQNVSAVFHPDGRLDPQLVIKKEPTREEESDLWVAPQPAAPQPIFNTPAGRLGVLICADSWHPQNYLGLDRPDLIAVPGAGFEGDKWSRPWNGPNAASGTEFPHDPDDVGRITEGEAWMQYTLPAYAESIGARGAVTSFLQGRLWDMSPSGQPILWREGFSKTVAPHERGHTISSVWL